MPFEERSRLISKRWKALSPTEREPYQRLSDLDGERFERDLQEHLLECASSSKPVKYAKWLREARMKPLENLLFSPDK